jgi:hypothetical protein
MKKSFFFKSSLVAVAALFMTACNENYDNPFAPTTADLDVTARVSTTNWAGKTGMIPDWAAPTITTSDGRQTALAEFYSENLEVFATPGVVMQQTIENLANGDYVVELYANSFFTPDRGELQSDMEDGAKDVAYVFANEDKTFIVANVGTSFSEPGLYTIKTKVTDGKLVLGLGKEKAGTNWHSIQIKSLIQKDAPIVKPETPEEKTDFTDLVKMDAASWNGSGVYNVEIATSDGRLDKMAEHYYSAFPCDEFPMHQTVSGLEDGTYTVVLNATSNLAWISSDVEAGAMDVAYVYAKCGDKVVKQPIAAGRETGFTEPGEYTIEIDVTGGEIELGLGLEKLDMTNWHTIQIKSLKLKK